MATGFAARIADARRMKNVSQKEAAAALEISQALLSHYEKGIREGNLDFLKRAAVYYDVTADYLIGLSDNRHGVTDFFTDADSASDEQFKSLTIHRAASVLGERAGVLGADKEKTVQGLFALALYRIIESLADIGAIDKKWLAPNLTADKIFSKAGTEFLNNRLQSGAKAEKYIFKKQPQSIKTVIEYCEEAIKTDLVNSFKGWS
ncbi:MAG: helix-turn-helix transcriptional regulator [Oscillospiraceae bacterium]|nr:helix-turn-helix transcriptional regulator [Oscillospiraceae bacterium]